MLSYSEFMASESINRFPSGERSVDGHKLKRAFEQKAPDQSPERMERLKKMLSESKTGRQTLEFLEEKGSELIFEKMNYYGYFSPDKNLVALNPKMSDEDLAVTFVHEMRHAWQDSQMESTTPELTPKAFFVTGFAIEADACAAEVTYAHEMREKNPKIWEAHQKSGYAPMSTAFEKTFNETGDVAKARESAFLTWYDLKVKNSYSDNYADYMSAVAHELNKQEEKEEQYFADNRSTKTVVDTYLKDYDGKPFMTEGKILETPAKLNVQESDARRMATHMLTYMKKYNRTEADLGLGAIAVKTKDGEKKTVADVFNTVKNERSQRARNAAAVRWQQQAASR